MGILFQPPTSVDRPPVDSAWTVRIVRVEFVRVDERMHRNPLWSVSWAAKWALLGRDQFGVSHLLGTNADTVNLLALARAVATSGDVAFDEPPTCGYCALPVAAGVQYCSPYERNCWLLDGARESAWRPA